MRVGIVLGFAVLTLACVGVAAASEAPLASAGLDQEGQVNATVYLDGGGSVAPDGSIARFEWSIEAPNGTTLAPDCPSCSQTWFVPQEEGRYHVTIRVTDEDGATSEDTLYVDVESGPSPPSQASSDAGGSSGFVTDSPGSGGSGGGGSTNAYIVEDGGELYVSGTLSADEYRVEGPGGEDLVIDGEEFRRAQTDPGRAPLDKFQYEMSIAGVTEEDAAEAVENQAGTCGTSAGNDCATSIESGSFDEQAEQTAEEHIYDDAGSSSAYNDVSTDSGDGWSSGSSTSSGSSSSSDSTLSDVANSLSGGIFGGDDSSNSGESSSSGSSSSSSSSSTVDSVTSSIGSVASGAASSLGGFASGSSSSSSSSGFSSSGSSGSSGRSSGSSFGF